MRAVNVMYNTALSQFIVLFELAMDRSDKARLPSKRIQNIIEFLTYSVYCYCCRGFFERHKLLFALLLSLKIQLRSGTLSMDHFNCFVKGGAALDIAQVRKKPKDWISDMSWLHLCNLASTLPLFRDLLESVARGDTQWRAWFDQEAPEAAVIPDFDDKLDKFHRLLMIRALREDRMLLAAADFVTEILGKMFVESVPLNLESAAIEATERVPLVCLLSPGSDPSDLIYALAKKKKKDLKSVSMGQGQEIIARRLIESGVTTGGWVMLNNTHLGLKFLSEVETTIIKREDIDPEFRLWITSEPHPKFPIGILQMSIKITNEAPVGIKAGLKRSYTWVNQDMLDSVPRAEWRTLLYIMCFLHSIVQERRKFGPIGWAIPYEFNQSDLGAAVQFLQNHMMDMEVKKIKDFVWAPIRYMISEIQYGGRITDDCDRRLMNTFADKYFNNETIIPNYTLFPSYVVPQGNEIAIFQGAIENLPLIDSPEIFGMHSNADLVYRSTLPVHSF